jgi:serine/threonine protein kinase
MHDSFKIRLRRYERMLYNGASAEALSSIKQRMQQIPKGITKSSDIFALGVSMHSVFCQSSLVQYNDEFTIVYMGLCLHQQKIYERTKQRIPSGIRDIVTRMIQIDPASRGNLDELVELIEKRIPQTEQELTREAQTIE